MFNFDSRNDNSKQHMFANPEYFDSEMTSENTEEAEAELTNPLLLPQQNREYYNSTAAFGSDSSARDSFIST